MLLLTLGHRAPLYPPLEISIAVGGSPWHMHPVLCNVPVAVTEQPQTFVLPANAPPGRYLKLTLHGRQQMQLEDGRYYCAIRYDGTTCAGIHTRACRSFEAFGVPMPSTHVRSYARRPRCTPTDHEPQLLVLQGEAYHQPGEQRQGRPGGLLSLLGMRS